MLRIPYKWSCLQLSFNITHYHVHKNQASAGLDELDETSETMTLLIVGAMGSEAEKKQENSSEGTEGFQFGVWVNEGEIQ